MPHTNVQACRAGHREFPQPTLLHFALSRSPTDKIFGALAVVALTPWWLLLPRRQGQRWRRWRLPVAAAAVGVGAAILWITSTLTLLNQRGACVLYANETLIAQVEGAGRGGRWRGAVEGKRGRVEGAGGGGR
jgi:hypothetical protein